MTETFKLLCNYLKAQKTYEYKRGRTSKNPIPDMLEKGQNALLTGGAIVDADVDVDGNVAPDAEDVMVDSLF
ncbi:hypothetical protein EUX98_g2094 [Antrodiella citrinella]|uniref:Uncharacterized protein n=1 Tax=Antrodiella citrinella TaxID=2447956 RepID=A0A4S4N2U3_9APHY|nr:hypothetical protein EUX98_g2094 [Antrodiella citrinella]